MKCADVMTGNLDCCEPTTTVAEVAKLMQAMNIGSVPVVDDLLSKKLIGLVTDRDLAINVVGKGLDSTTTQVSEVMSRDLVTCLPDDNLDTALMLMEQCRVRRIPVVNAANQVVGIIAQADLATRLKDPQLTHELLQRISACR